MPTATSPLAAASSSSARDHIAVSNDAGMIKPVADRIICTSLARLINSLQVGDPELQALDCTLTLSLRPALHHLICAAASRVHELFQQKRHGPKKDETWTLSLSRRELAAAWGYDTKHYDDLAVRVEQLRQFVHAARFSIEDAGWKVDEHSKNNKMVRCRMRYEFDLGELKYSDKCLQLSMSHDFVKYLISAGYVTRANAAAWHFDHRAWQLRGKRQGDYAFGIYVSLSNVAGMSHKHQARISVKALLEHAPELQRRGSERGSAFMMRQLYAALDRLQSRRLICSWRLDAGMLIAELRPPRLQLEAVEARTPDGAVKTPDGAVGGLILDNTINELLKLRRLIT